MTASAPHRFGWGRWCVMYSHQHTLDTHTLTFYMPGCLFHISWSFVR